MKVFKYLTGMEIPSNATYIHSRVEKLGDKDMVWHYFIVKSSCEKKAVVSGDSEKKTNRALQKADELMELMMGKQDD